jgi:hypothetical protein
MAIHATVDRALKWKVLNDAWVLANTMVWILLTIGGTESTAHDEGRQHGPEELRWVIPVSSVDDQPRRDDDPPSRTAREGPMPILVSQAAPNA